MGEKSWEILMGSVSEKLAKAKAAPRPFLDVSVALTDTLSEGREALRASLVEAKKSRAKDHAEKVAKVEAELEALLIAEAESLLTLRFRKLPGDVWADLTAQCPLRLNSPIDRRYGYNILAVVKLAAPLSGVSLEGDAEVPLIVEDKSDDNPEPVNEWADLFSELSGHEVSRIVDTVYRLNEYDPAERVDRLKKASTAMAAYVSNSA